MARVRLTSPAQTDLNAIWLYLAKDSIAAADRVIDRIYESAGTFASHPNAGTPADRFKAGLRCFAVGRIVVFYEPTEDGLLIIRVLHGARNLDDLFK
jgi:toxin ParE1/3/4